MKRILIQTRWQLVLLSRYNILSVAIAMAIFYALLFIIFPVTRVDEFTGYAIFSDPGQLGFIFIGAMVLFEKSENTFPAQNITPMSNGEYLWAKAMALLVPTLIGSLAIAFAAWQTDFHIILLTITVIATSLLFTFLGFSGVARVKTFNQYMLIIPVFLAPTALPLLNFLTITHWKILYIIPTQSVLSLLKICRSDTINWLEVTLHFAYLTAWIYLAYRLALNYYNKYLVK